MSARIVIIAAVATLTGLGMLGCERQQGTPPEEAHSAPARDDPSVYGRYLAIQTALAADSLAGVADAARAIAQGVRGAAAAAFPPRVAEQAEAVAAAQDLAAAREAFKLLSETLIEALASQPEKDRYHVVECSMANGRWLQDTTTIANPYYGKSMLRCGEISAAAKE